MISLTTHLHHNKTGWKAPPPPPQQAFVHPDMESFKFQTHIYVTTIIIDPPKPRPLSKGSPPSGQGSPVHSVDISSSVKNSLTHIFDLPLLHSFIAVGNVQNFVNIWRSWEWWQWWWIMDIRNVDHLGRKTVTLCSLGARLFSTSNWKAVNMVKIVKMVKIWFHSASQ